MSWSSDCARCAGPVAIWVCRVQPTVMWPNRCPIAASSFISALWCYRGPIHALGYRRIRSALAKEGWTVSRKQVQRIRRREGLKVRPKPKKISRRGVSTGLPTQATHPHHVWTWDFIFDRTDNGGTLKRMTLLDEYTRQCLTIRVERQITSAHVLEVLEKAMVQ